MKAKAKLPKTRLYTDSGIYVNEMTAMIPQNKDFHLTVDIDTFWNLAFNKEFVGFTASLSTLNLGDLFIRSKFRQLIIHADRSISYDIVFFILQHTKYREKIAILDMATVEMITTEQWIAMVGFTEGAKGRLDGVRHKTILLLKRFARDGVLSVDILRLLEEYEDVYAEEITKDVMLRALALKKQKIKQVYRPALDRGVIKCSRVSEKGNSLMSNTTTKRRVNHDGK